LLNGRHRTVALNPKDNEKRNSERSKRGRTRIRSRSTSIGTSQRKLMKHFVVRVAAASQKPDEKPK